MKFPKQPSVIITGASTGIGRGLALSLANIYKARMVLTARSETALLSLQEEVKKRGGEAVAIAGDITSADISDSLVETAVKHFGKLNVIVNNAGMGIGGSFSKLTEEDWRRVFEVNFFSALKLTQKALPHLKSQDHSKIINISSVAGKIAIPGSVSYCASKFALTALSEGLAAELAGDNIDVITVCPGWVRTEFFEKNNLPDERNPTVIAQKNDLAGLMMKHLLSISTEECVKEVIEAMDKGGSQEIILTMPGRIAERLHGIAPGMMRFLAKKIKPTYRD